MGLSPISIRIVHIDQYIAAPGPLDREWCPFSSVPVSRVPVIRIFGSTPSGQKTCLHIHQVYPYFYVPCSIPVDNVDQIQRYIYLFGTSLNQALQAARKSKDRGSTHQSIAAIVLVKAVPFYGYHVGYSTFLKICLLDPTEKSRAVELLENGAVLNTRFQPYEAHIPYELQFMSDYNLYGMDYIDIRIPPPSSECGPRFCRPLPSQASTQSLPTFSSSSQRNHAVYTADTIPMSLQSDFYPRRSYCELELDAVAMDITNRSQLQQRDIHTHLDKEIKLGQESVELGLEKLVTSLNVIWKDEEQRRLAKGLTSPLVAESPECRAPNSAWSTQEACYQLFSRMVAADAKEQYISPNDLDGIQSAFHSIEALYPQRTASTTEQPSAYSIDKSSSGVRQDAVQESLLSSRFTLSESQSFYQILDEAVEAQYDRQIIDSIIESQSTDTENLDPSELMVIAEEAERGFEHQDGLDDDEDNDDEIDVFDPISSWTSDIQDNNATDHWKPAVEIAYEDEIPSETAGNESHQSDTQQKPSAQDVIPQLDGPSDDPNVSSDDSKQTPVRRKRKASHDNHESLSRLLSRSSSSHHSKSSSNQGYNGEDDGQHFTKSIAGMWSPRTLEVDSASYMSFYTDPPKPISPARQSFSSNHAPLDKHIRTPPRWLSSQQIHDSSPTLATRFIFDNPPPLPAPNNQRVLYQEPYYSNPADVPSYVKTFAGKTFDLKSKDVSSLKVFQPLDGLESIPERRDWKACSTIRSCTPATRPPSRAVVEAWLKDKGPTYLRPQDQRALKSQIEGPTAKNTYDTKFNATKPDAMVTYGQYHLDILSVEILVLTREGMLPDPEMDTVQIVFWSLQTDRHIHKTRGYDDRYVVGIIAVGDIDFTMVGMMGVDVEYVQDEISLLYQLIHIVRTFDPDLLTGYELHNASWGYLIDRARIFDIDMINELSRCKVEPDITRRDAWGYKKATVYRIVGRHMLNIWRLMRGVVSTNSYTFENIAFHVLHHRAPYFSSKTLTTWYTLGNCALKYRLFRYFVDRVQMNLDILDASNIIQQTCESSRVFGIDFYSVLTRGSQYVVESVMIRIAKPENFIFISPNRKQVGAQRAIQCLPLVMEPISQFYSSPMVVLDFQSLYPSVMIAYNYCFSTCLGRLRDPKESAKFGVTDLNLPPGLLSLLKDDITISPNGIVFVKPRIRRGLLGRMLSEALSARVMVKKAMNIHMTDEGLLRILNARQLTLKYVANVTYGYTSASFSGRMPAVEIADSIVQTGREILEKTIKMINETALWGARVVYGDTDSVFVYLEGKSKEEAFKIGQDMANTITGLHPAPIKIKFEKVYHPSILVTKKRYVGFKYEHPSDTVPVFDAKGIETVRRDGTPATQKIMENSIKILFRTQDMSELKTYLYRQWRKILSNRISLQDFIIAKEVRMGSYSGNNLPHGAVVAQSNMAKDPRMAPQYGERVPYMVVYRGTNATLRERVVRPEDMINNRQVYKACEQKNNSNSSLVLDAEYYIRKQIIPPLSRIFNLIGVDVQAWYDDMPRPPRPLAQLRQQERSMGRIDQYYASRRCIVCRQITNQVICDACQAQPAQPIYTLAHKQQQAETRLRDVLLICQNCTQLTTIDTSLTDSPASGYGDIPCESMDCPFFYERKRQIHQVQASQFDTLIKKSWPLQ